MKSTLRNGERRLPNLCAHFGVEFQESSAHDATYDSRKLAECVAEAQYRGVMLPNEPKTAPMGKAEEECAGLVSPPPGSDQ